MASKGATTGSYVGYVAIPSQVWSASCLTYFSNADGFGANHSPIEVNNNNEYASLRAQLKINSAAFYSHGGTWTHVSIGELKDQWFHIGVSYNNGVAKSYRNGVLMSTVTLPAGFTTRSWINSGSAKILMCYEYAGRMANIGIWGSELAIEDWRQLGIVRVSPAKVSADTLAMCSPTIRSSQNTFGSTFGSPQQGYVDHPKVYCP